MELGARVVIGLHVATAPRAPLLYRSCMQRMAAREGVRAAIPVKRSLPSQRRSFCLIGCNKETFRWPNRNLSRPRSRLSAALKAKQSLRLEKKKPWRRTRSSRIERHDAKINAFCVREFRAAEGGGAGRRRNALGARRDQAPARPASDGSGILQHRDCQRPGITLRRRVQAGGRRASDHAPMMPARHPAKPDVPFDSGDCRSI